MLVVALTACTAEELVHSVSESKLEATVEYTNHLSRVGFKKADSWSFFWHNGDQIWINGGIMNTSAADGSKTATFTGYGVDTQSGYAVYPYVIAENNVSGTVLTWNFPESYDYTIIDNDFFESKQAVPMFAEIANGKGTFKHLGAIFAIKVNDWDLLGNHVFTLTSSKKITGEFSVDLSEDTPVFETTSEEEDVVTINYSRPANSGESSIVFYVPIPTGTYSLKPAISVDGITYYSPEKENVTVARGDIVWAEVGESSMEGGS